MAGYKARETGNISLYKKVTQWSNIDATCQRDIGAGFKGFYNQIVDNFTIQMNHESNRFNTLNRVESTSPNWYWKPKPTNRVNTLKKEREGENGSSQ